MSDNVMDEPGASRLPDPNCLRCGKIMAVGIPADGKTKPAALNGHVLICSGCGHVHCFNHDLTLREPNYLEKAAMNLNPQLMKQINAVRKYARQQAAKN